VDVVSERVPGGLRDYDRATHELVALEVWDASTRVPAPSLEALPTPNAHSAAAQWAFGAGGPRSATGAALCARHGVDVVDVLDTTSGVDIERSINNIMYTTKFFVCDVYDSRFT